MSAVTERVTESNVKIQHKLKTSSKPGLGVQKENFGLHHSKRVNDAPSTCTPARKPLGNVSNTIRKSSVPQKTNIVKKKPTTDMMMMLDECPDMEYMPKTSESDVKEPFQEPDYFKDLLEVMSNPSLFSSGRKDIIPDAGPLKSTIMFSQTAGFFCQPDIGDIEDFTIPPELPNIDDIII